ncbi:MAG TPA: hypothetical protein PLW66_00480 [Saprospiraceae bacterium]|nr:hypothetical protein [Saprospiraceae bacterium]
MQISLLMSWVIILGCNIPMPGVARYFKTPITLNTNNMSMTL